MKNFRTYILVAFILISILSFIGLYWQSLVISERQRSYVLREGMWTLMEGERTLLDLIVINDRLMEQPFRKEIPILRYQDIAGTATRLRALTSLMPDEFATVLPVFEAAFLERMRAYTIDGLPRLNRRYTPYKNSPLPTIEDKLLFILIHIKQNLTQEVHGQLFGMIQSDANKWLHVLRPVLAEAVQRLDVLPARLAATIEQAKTPVSDDPPFFIMMVPNGPFNDP